MYILVFVTLIVALTGVYAQVLGLQTSRFYSNQTTVADAMLTWHATAIAQARYAGIKLTTVAQQQTGCGLNAYVAGALWPACANPVLGAVTIRTTPPGGAWNACSGTPALPCWTSLPVDYQTEPTNPNGPYSFYSIFYEPAAGEKYVITLVPPVPAAAGNPNGFIMLPGTQSTGAGAANSKEIGITMSELTQQIKNDSLIPVSYGTISNVGCPVAGSYCLVTPAFSNGGAAMASYQYTLPTGLNLAYYNGSLAIISTP